MPHTMSPEAREREKSNAALSSVMAAVLLTGLKLFVGVTTNSLGILSEAAHSAFDLLAAGITFFAVRYAAHPADKGHPYGHGKIENLSALVESLLLLVTCIWIVWEAIDRLFFNHVVVEPTFWALGVMVISIVVDISRSRMLMRVAKKHKSQALEADALHFSTDIWSSAVVILGLGALYLASFLPAGSLWTSWLQRADSLAALGVSLIVVHVSVTLARQAVNVLLDAGDRPLARQIGKTVRGLAGIRDIERLRLRHSGPTVFVDLAVSVSGSLVLEQVQQLRDEVEMLVKAVEPGIDITLEVLPDAVDNGDLISHVRSLAVTHGLDVHAIEILDVLGLRGHKGKDLLQLHVEMEPGETLAVAHAVVSSFEARLRQEFPAITIVTHIEPKGEGEAQETLMQGREADRVRDVIRRILDEQPGVYDSHNVLLRSYGEGQRVSFHCRMAPETTVQAAHDEAGRIQTALHQRLPELKMITVHMEPLHSDGGAAANTQDAPAVPQNQTAP